MARFIYPVGSGGGSASANIADFIFINNDEDVSTITVPVNKEMTIETTRDDEEDADINIYSADDIFIRANGDDVNIEAADEVVIESMGGDYTWRFDNTGCLELPANGEICNIPNSSGDGYGYSTIKIIPDNSLQSDQYLIVDPTAPNHIHLRAGGTQDASNAELYLGGEKTHVRIVDNAGVARMQASYTYNNTYYPGDWTSAVVTENEFNRTLEITDPSQNILDFLASSDWNGASDVYIGFDGGEKGPIFGQNSTETTLTFFLEITGTPSGPTAIASLELYYEQRSRVAIDMNDDEELSIVGKGIDVNIFSSDNVNVESENNVSIDANNNIVLFSQEGGQFLHTSEFPNNQIATIGDIANAQGNLYYGSFYDLTDQSGSAGSIQAMKFGQTDLDNGVSIQGLNNTQITMENSGVYNIAFSAQLHQTNSQGIVEIWLSKNGTPISHSNTKIVISANDPFKVAAWNFFVESTPEDYYEIMWSSDSANTVLEHVNETGSGPTLKPAIPSVILTVNQVGQ